MFSVVEVDHWSDREIDGIMKVSEMLLSQRPSQIYGFDMQNDCSDRQTRISQPPTAACLSSLILT